MTQERYSVIVVGGGPAGLAAAITLARGGLRDVVVLERGVRSGAKNVMGGILFTPSLERLFPRLWEGDAPLERPVTRRTWSLLTADSAIDLSFRSAAFAAPPYNHAFTVLRGPFDAWLAGKAEKEGVTLVTGVVVDGFLRDERGRVTGVRTRVEEGADPAEGHLPADLVILAEGANALLAEREGLRAKVLPHDMAVSVKEVVALPAGTIRERFLLGDGEGEGREYYGGSVRGIFGSGFVYTNRESLSVGVAVSVKDLAERGWTPNDLLEGFKAHPALRPLLEGGETLEYSAHMIPEGGYYRLGDLAADGVLMAGDAAGLVNVSPYHEGANLAIASGMMAAETALEALAAGDVSAAGLAGYRRRLEESFVLKDMRKYADLPGFLRENPQLFSRWPEALAGAVRDLLTVSEDPKQVLEDRALGRLVREIGLVPLLTTLWGLRGATRSLYHDATEKAVDFLRRNW